MHSCSMFDVFGSVAPRSWICALCEHVNAGAAEQCLECAALPMHDVSQGDASDALVAVDDGVDEQGSFRVPDQKAPRRDSGEVLRSTI